MGYRSSIRDQHSLLHVSLPDVAYGGFVFPFKRRVCARSLSPVAPTARAAPTPPLTPPLTPSATLPTAAALSAAPSAPLSAMPLAPPTCSSNSLESAEADAQPMNQHGRWEALEPDFVSPSALLLLHDSSDHERIGLGIRAVHSNASRDSATCPSRQPTRSYS